MFITGGDYGLMVKGLMVNDYRCCRRRLKFNG